MYIFTELICVTIEVFLIILYLTYSFSFQKSFLNNALSILIMFIGLGTLSFIENAAFIRLGFTFLSILLTAYFIFKATFFQALIHSLVYCIFIVIVEVITSIIFIVLNIHPEEILKLGSGRSLFIIITHIIFFCSFLLLLCIRPLVTTKYSLKELLVIIPCMIVSGLLCYILVTEYIIQNKNVPGLYIIVLLGLLYTNVLFLFISYRNHIQIAEKQKYELEIQHFYLQQDYYEKLHCQQESIRSLWHDLNKYVAASKIDSSESYKQLKNQLNDITASIDTNNHVLNVILNEYLYKAKDLDTHFVMDVNVPDTLSMTVADLYIILGNSLDNALNACALLDKQNRIINITLKTKNNILYYEISNPYKEITKRKSGIHGYGINNIKKIVSKYSGETVIQQDSNIFTLSIHLNL